MLSSDQQGWKNPDAESLPFKPACRAPQEAEAVNP
jgi:hypothetical protein